MSELDIQMEIPSEVGLGNSKKKKAAAAAKETKEGKSHKERGHHHHKENLVLTAGWKEKCRKDKAWCDKFLGKFVMSSQEKKLFGGKKRPHIVGKERDKIYHKCRVKLGFRTTADFEKATSKQKETLYKCCGTNLVYAQLFGLKHAKKMARGGKLSDGETSGSLTVWLILGVMLLLVFASIGAYFALLRGKKGKDTLGKGSTKLGKLKSRRSGKSSKSARMSSRKSAKKSAKRSVSGNSRPSAGRGTKKSANKK